MSYGGRSRHLKWCHIRTKTEQLSGRNKKLYKTTLFLFYAKFTAYIMEKQLVLTVKDGSIRHRIDVTGYWFSKTWSP